MASPYYGMKILVAAASDRANTVCILYSYFLCSIQLLLFLWHVYVAKKQRQQSCWETLQEGLCSSKDTTATTSWWDDKCFLSSNFEHQCGHRLQLISWLLSKWDNSLPSSEHLSVLSILQSLLRDRETKRLICLPLYIQYLFQPEIPLCSLF